MKTVVKDRAALPPGERLKEDTFLLPGTVYRGRKLCRMRITRGRDVYGKPNGDVTIEWVPLESFDESHGADHEKPKVDD